MSLNLKTIRIRISPFKQVWTDAHDKMYSKSWLGTVSRSTSLYWFCNILWMWVIGQRWRCNQSLWFISLTSRSINTCKTKFVWPPLCHGITVDHNDGQFFRAMEWLMFFFRPPLLSMVFQWFWQSWTITIECFLGGPTIGTNGFLMVFKILRAMVNNGFEVKHAKCGMRQVWFVTAMRGNKYQRRLTIDFTTTKPNQDCNCDHRIVQLF